MCDMTHQNHNCGTKCVVDAVLCERKRPMWYGVATISRLLKTIGLFCKRTLYKRRYSAKETYDFKEHTNRSHPILWPVHSTRNLKCFRKKDLEFFEFCWYQNPWILRRNLQCFRKQDLVIGTNDFTRLFSKNLVGTKYCLLNSSWSGSYSTYESREIVASCTSCNIVNIMKCFEILNCYPLHPMLFIPDSDMLFAYS